MHGFGEQPGGEHDEQCAGDLEETAQVELAATAVHDHPQHRRHAEAEQPTDHHRCTRRRARLGAEQEQHGLEALASHCAEGHQRHGGGRAVGGGIELAVQFGRHAPRVLAHPEDHPGEHRGGDERQRALDRLLGTSLELADQYVEGDTGDHAHGSGDAGTGGDRWEQLATTGLGEVGQHDGEHE